MTRSQLLQVARRMSRVRYMYHPRSSVIAMATAFTSAIIATSVHAFKYALPSPQQRRCFARLGLHPPRRRLSFSALHHSMCSSPNAIAPDPSRNRFHAPIVYHPNYSFSGWPGSHTFPMDKFAAIGGALTTRDRKFSKLPRPLVRSYDDFFRPLEGCDVPRSWMASPTGPIDAAFLDCFLSGDLDSEHCRRIGFREHTSRPELIERTVLEVAGTVLASQLSYQWGISSNVAGGTHHARPWGGAGYTILNDLAVAANFLTDERVNGGTVKGIRRVLVIDCDVHQGDGTAKFDELHRSNRLHTLSLHCESNYPHPKSQSTYDVGLRDGMEDEEYLGTLKGSVARAVDEVKPDFVLYDAGVDVYKDDTLGRISLSEDGIRARDRYVLETCVDAGIPVAAVVGGGYDKDLRALGRRHAIVHEECAYVWRKHRMWER